MDRGAKAYGNTSSETVVELHIKQKKDKYLEACHERRWDFMPLVYTVNSFAAKETCRLNKHNAPSPLMGMSTPSDAHM